MPEQLKQLINVADQPVNSTANVNLVAPAANTQFVISEIDYAVRGTPLSGVVVKHGDRVIHNGGPAAVLEGRLLVESGDAVTIDFTALRGTVFALSPDRAWIGNDDAVYAFSDAGIFAYDAAFVSLPGGDYLAVVTGDKCQAYDMDGQLVSEAALPVTNCYCIAWRGDRLFIKSSTSDNKLYALLVNDGGTLGAVETLTASGSYAAFAGRELNSDGALEAFGQCLYTVSSNGQYLYISSAGGLSFSTRLSVGVGSYGAYYVFGSAIITTTESTPRNLLVISGPAATAVIDLETEMVTRYTASSERPTYAGSVRGNAGCQIEPGVFYVKSRGYGLHVDFNNGDPVFTQVGYGGGFFGSEVGAQCVLTSIDTHPAYDVYAYGVEITTE